MPLKWQARIQNSGVRIQNGVVVASLLRILKIDLAEGQFLILAPDFWLLNSPIYVIDAKAPSGGHSKTGPLDQNCLF